MKKIELFEPAMCCPTGVCGPSVDETLLMITNSFEALQKVADVDAKRHCLSDEPATFSKNPDVLNAIKKDGKDALPITIVDGKVVKVGEYPTQDELTQYTGVVFKNENADVVSK